MFTSQYTNTTPQIEFALHKEAVVNLSVVEKKVLKLLWRHILFIDSSPYKMILTKVHIPLFIFLQLPFLSNVKDAFDPLFKTLFAPLDFLKTYESSTGEESRRIYRDIDAWYHEGMRVIHEHNRREGVR